MADHLYDRITLFGFLFLFSCQSVKQIQSSPFRMVDACYYTWLAGMENERGTNIEITVDRLHGKVQFVAVVFRNMEIPVATITDGKRVLLKGVIPGPGSALQDLTVPREGTDRLLYVLNGDSSSVRLIDFRREEMRVLKPK